MKCVEESPRLSARGSLACKFKKIFPFHHQRRVINRFLTHSRRAILTDKGYFRAGSCYLWRKAIAAGISPVRTLHRSEPSGLKQYRVPDET